MSKEKKLKKGELVKYTGTRQDLLHRNISIFADNILLKKGKVLSVSLLGYWASVQFPAAPAVMLPTKQLQKI